MLVTEAQGKALLRAAAIATPSSQELRSLDEARSCRIELPVAVKAQVAAGGRGKAGGIRKANSPAELENAFDAIMGMRFAGEALAVRAGRILAGYRARALSRCGDR